ncbi:MAG: lipid-A-disaccharide synthase-related protein [Cyanobium sp. M30B3]|jgi:uncharacterized protein (TIGR03492 family)|nr:MAG: lipid-A-disaccharide synthase-related protein [Cyanobium sp. M30B3]
MPPRLLVLTNGHGEDQIALQLIAALRQRTAQQGLPPRQVVVLPLVGQGQAFAAAEAHGLLQRQGPRQTLPSGGFSNQSLGGLLRDLGAGLAGLSLRQWRWLRHWGRGGQPVLAVGDLLPLLLAWGSGSPFAFVGTPKSDYTWASPSPPGWGHSPLADAYHRCKGSEWDPWEWRLMASGRCRLVAVRDALTARGLRRHGIPALAPGNPMLDGFPPSVLPPWLAGQRRLLLLPGSRMPEALHNGRRLLAGLAAWHSPQPSTVLLTCGDQPSSAAWSAVLLAAGWREAAVTPEAAAAGASRCWRRGPLTLLLGVGRFMGWAPWGEVGLATAGTATEQLVGLGIPVLSSPGPGPQFKAGFARRQSRLLGGAVQPCHTPADLAAGLEHLLADATRRAQLGRIGRRRMGPEGGSGRLAQLLLHHLLG